MREREKGMLEAVALSPALSLPAWEALPDLGLYMDQVIVLMERAFDGVLPEGEITRSMVNNYVKQRLIPRPEGKKYAREHLALLMMIGILKQALTMEEIAALLGMLCGEGVRAGYEWFLGEIASLGEAARSGCLALWTEAARTEEQIVRAGVAAALCTIDARRAISCAKNEKK